MDYRKLKQKKLQLVRSSKRFFFSVDILLVLFYTTATLAVATTLWQPWEGVELSLRKTHFAIGMLLWLFMHFWMIREIKHYFSSAMTIIAAVIYFLLALTSLPLPTQMERFLAFSLANILFFIFLFPMAIKNVRRFQVYILMVFFLPAISYGPFLLSGMPVGGIHQKPHHLAGFVFLGVFLWHLRKVAPNSLGGIKRNLLRMAPILVILPAVFASGFLTNRSIGVDPAAPPDDRQLVLRLNMCIAGGCHNDFIEDWKVSTHRFAGANRAYDAILKKFTDEFGQSESVFCDRCHNPMMILAGIDRWDGNDHTEDLSQGVNCAGCHLIDATQVNIDLGNGLNQYRKPRNLFPGADPNHPKTIRLQCELIKLSLYDHENVWNFEPKEFWNYTYNESVTCGGCHKVTMPTQYTGGKTLVLGDTFTPWLNSDLFKKNVTCADCHFQMKEDPRAPAFGFLDHKSPGLNQSLEALMPANYPEEDFSRELIELKQYIDRYVAGRSTISKVDDLLYYNAFFLSGKQRARSYIENTPIKIELRAESEIRPGNAFSLIVDSSNASGAHDIPTGLLDLLDVWLFVEVKDANSVSVFNVGDLDETGEVDPRATRLGAKLFDADGKPIMDHRFWHIQSAEVKSIKIGQTLTEKYTIDLTPKTRLPLRVEVKWQYRRYSKQAAQEIFGPGVYFPVTVLASTTTSLP